ncbi:hypothetical protein BDD12DRAFT_346101 [Trichophaea hybrida]|nr:hypothetical protein BDD12DRAFT_346101 [Trichophaea hybrida]
MAEFPTHYPSPISHWGAGTGIRTHSIVAVYPTYIFRSDTTAPRGQRGVCPPFVTRRAGIHIYSSLSITNTQHIPISSSTAQVPPHSVPPLKIRPLPLIRITTRTIPLLRNTIPSTSSLLRIPPHPSSKVTIRDHTVNTPLGILARHIWGSTEAVTRVSDDTVDRGAACALGVGGEVAVLALR